MGFTEAFRVAPVDVMLVAAFVVAVGDVEDALGVTLLEGVDAGPVPAELVAVTVKVYVVLLVSPFTVMGLDGLAAVMPLGLDVTVYDVIALPPFEAGAVKLTLACALPATAVTPVGAPGTVGEVGGARSAKRLLPLKLPQPVALS